MLLFFKSLKKQMKKPIECIKTGLTLTVPFFTIFTITIIGIAFATVNYSVSAENANNNNNIKADEAKVQEIPFSKDSGYIKNVPLLSKLFGENFSFKDEKGKQLSFDDFKNQVIVIILSTTWCPNCPTALKAADILKNRLQEEKISGVKVIAFNVGNEDIAEVKDHYAKCNVEFLEAYESVSLNDNEAIQGVPACLIFAKDGSPICGYLGWHDFSSDEFAAFLKKLAAQKDCR